MALRRTFEVVFDFFQVAHLTAHHVVSKVPDEACWVTPQVLGDTLPQIGVALFDVASEHLVVSVDILIVVSSYGRLPQLLQEISGKQIVVAIELEFLRSVLI